MPRIRRRPMRSPKMAMTRVSSVVPMSAAEQDRPDRAGAEAQLDEIDAEDDRPEPEPERPHGLAGQNAAARSDRGGGMTGRRTSGTCLA